MHIVDRAAIGRSGRSVGLAVALTAAAAVLPVSAGAQSAGESSHAVVLVTTYADGRTVHDIVTRAPRVAWTPLFPRVGGGARDRGLLVTAVQYERVLQDDGSVKVVASVLRGQAHEQQQRIASVVVSPDTPVRVDALASVGVAPVALAIVPLSPTTLYPPQVRNQTAGLEIATIEILQSPAPGYQVTVRNVSSQPALNFHFVTYLGDRMATSGNRGNPDASPIVAPSGTYTFTVSPGRRESAQSAGWAPTALDTIEIAAVLWENGDIEGDAAPMAAALSVYLGRAEQLTRGLAILTAASLTDDARAEIERRVARLSVEPDESVVSRLRQRLRHLEGFDEGAARGACRTAMAATRNGMLDDLREAPTEDAAFRQWLGEIIVTYQTRQQRLSGR